MPDHDAGWHRPGPRLDLHHAGGRPQHRLRPLQRVVLPRQPRPHLHIHPHLLLRKAKVSEEEEMMMSQSRDYDREADYHKSFTH